MTLSRDGRDCVQTAQRPVTIWDMCWSQTECSRIRSFLPPKTLMVLLRLPSDHFDDHFDDPFADHYCSSTSQSGHWHSSSQGGSYVFFHKSLFDPTNKEQGILLRQGAVQAAIEICILLCKGAATCFFPNLFSCHHSSLMPPTWRTQ